MRPQHCCCGNSRTPAPVPRRTLGFNEAAALLLRKCKKMGAPEASPIRFNEAAALLLRKFGILQATGGNGKASMRPQHCCCGNNRPRNPCGKPFDRFNEAAALLLRKYLFGHRSHDLLKVLQ